jgi:hypothetical protein
MAILGREHGYLFLQAPRTGSSAVGKWVLMPHAGGVDFPAADVRDASGALIVPQKHCTVSEIRAGGLLSAADIKRLLVFTTVRNPFDSLVTQYLTMRERYVNLIEDPTSWVHNNPVFVRDTRLALDRPFNEWAVQKLASDPRPAWWKAWRWGRQSQHMYRSFIEHADVVMRYERLQDDLDGVLVRLGLEPIEIPRRNVTPTKGDYRTYYDDASRRAVAARFALDLDRFGYEF